MFSARFLHSIGFPPDRELTAAALKLLNTAAARGADQSVLADHIRRLVRAPQALLDDPLFGPLASLFAATHPDGIRWIPRDSPAPWKQWGTLDGQEDAVRQMENACALPNAVRGALMPDAHVGYGLPIGGVLAVKGAVIPYAVGVDIACRMRLSVLDMPLSRLVSAKESLAAALERETRFGVGAGFAEGERRDHAVMEEDWTFCPVVAALKDKAHTQLGTSGGGNHFVEFGELCLHALTVINGVRLEKGSYLALLSHSGSRGSGEAVARHYSGLAMRLRPEMPPDLKHLAWLATDSAEGMEYLRAMRLMGRYAAANHELIHARVLHSAGARALVHVENHHNFAWEETYDGETVIVHRKGATPAGKDTLGIIPGSMATPGFLVRGKGNKDALHSCSHGAGRLMSRAAALKTLNRDAFRDLLAERGVELLSGSLDESPTAYKDIHAVMDAQRDLIDIAARFEPRLVKMAPPTPKSFRRKKKKR